MFTKSAVNIPNAMYYYQICVDIKRIGRYREELYEFLNIGCVILILKTVLSENFMRAVYV